MPALADPPAPVIEFVTIRRLKDGVEVDAELCVRFQPAYGPLPASLSIGADWRPSTGEYRRTDFYDVEVLDSPMGRAFRLHRSAAKVERDPDGQASYGVLVAGRDSRCECRGFAGAERGGRPCKHVAAMTGLIEAGVL